MSNFWQRTLTGIVFVIAVIGSVLADYLTFAGVIAVFLSVGLWEFFSLAEKKNIFPLKIPTIIVGLVIFFTVVFSNTEIISGAHYGKIYAVVFLLILFLIIFELFRKTESPLENIAVSVGGLMYVAVPFSVLVSLPSLFPENPSFGKLLPIMYFILMWVYDIFAYLTGMLMGRHKLFERISPKKSWEGVIGGTFFCLAFSVLLSRFFPELNVAHWMIMAFIVVVFGTLGDLVESMLKRSAGVKDSGMFFPGHGGVLDRFDAVLISVPFVYFYLKFFI